MDIKFNDPELTDLYEGQKVALKYRSNPALIKQFVKTVKKLQSVEKLEQLYQFQSLKYKKLTGNWKGHSSVRINDQYRLLFKEVITDTEPPEVVCCVVEQISNHYS
jgi:toxin HigB-1